MRRRLFPSFIGDVVKLNERQERMERVMQIFGISPEYPYTININDGTRNTVQIGLVDGVYGIKIVDNAGNEILLANGTIVADAIKTGTLDCDLITVANLSAGDIVTGTLSANFISGGVLDCSLMTVSNLNAGSITVGTFSSPNDRFGNDSLSGVKISGGTITGNKLVAYAVEADKIASGAIETDKLAAGAVIASKINVTQLSAISSNIGTIIAGSITADVINVGTLNANRIPGLNTSKLISGAYNVGGSSQPTMIYIKRSSSYADAFLRWEGGSRIWSDANNRIGINSIGSPMYIYVNSWDKIIIPEDGQVTIKGGVYITATSGSGHLNVEGNFRLDGHISGSLNMNGEQLLNCSEAWFTIANTTTINNTTLYGNNIWYWNLYHYSEAFDGNPFPIIKSIKRLKKGKKLWGKLDHKKLHSEIYARKKDKSGKMRDVMNVGKLIMIQTEAISRLNKRLEIVEELLNQKKKTKVEILLNKETTKDYN